MPDDDKVLRFPKRKPPPYQRTYSPTTPYVVYRNDLESGAIYYDVCDDRPTSYRVVC